MVERADIRPDARSRIVETAVDLYWRQGLNGTGVRQILDQADAPKGSLYFHFPGGKEELAAEALTVAGRKVTDSLVRALTANRETGEAVEAFVLSYRDLTVSSGFELGCPLATATLEAAGRSERIRKVAEQTFSTWRGLIREHLEAGHCSRTRAGELATFTVAAIEGALILARADRGDESLVTTANLLRDLLGSPERQ